MGTEQTANTRYIPKHKSPERQLQLQCCDLLRSLNIKLFKSDYGSGLLLSQNQARMQARMQSNRGWPDMMIFKKKTITRNGITKTYCGLAIELKTEGTTIMLTRGPRKGRLTSDPHIREQYRTLKDLEAEGWYVNFACGYDEFERIIFWYFNIPRTTSIF